jgi:hypothetical protein|uniref:Uncharacterized protein n=1 Tax=Zea mays TaxID=4577 RepID=A0A804P5G0_MAIZE
MEGCGRRDHCEEGLMMRGSNWRAARACARISVARSDSRGNGRTWKRVEGAASSAARISGATCTSLPSQMGDKLIRLM